MDQRLTGQGIKKQNKKNFKKKNTGIIPAWKEKILRTFFFSKVLILIKTVIKQKISYYCIGLTA
jgi:hypothetical protein